MECDGSHKIGLVVTEVTRDVGHNDVRTITENVSEITCNVSEITCDGCHNSVKLGHEKHTDTRCDIGHM